MDTDEFLSLRRFPHLRAMQTHQRGTMFVDHAAKAGAAPAARPQQRTLSVRRPLQHSPSTSATLQTYSASSLGELTSLRDFHRTLISHRMKHQKKARKAGQPELQRQARAAEAAARAADTDGDGNVSAAEALAALGPAHERALAKLRDVAVCYDSQRHGNSLEGFQGAMMSPLDLKEQLRRSLSIRLLPDELDAVVAEFDSDGNGYIDGAEFLRHFCRLGFEGRSAAKAARIGGERAAAAARAAERDAAEAAADAARDAAAVAGRHTAADRASAVAKLTKLAAAWAPVSTADGRALVIGERISAFQCTMTPSQFDNQLQRSFNLKLSPGELGGLFEALDADKSGSVSGTEFIVLYFGLRKAALERGEKSRKAAERRRVKATTARMSDHALRLRMTSTLGR